MTERESITKDPNIRKGVIPSVIASLIVIFCIQPILRFVWSAMLTLGTSFLQRYIDSIYASAALGHRNYIDVMLLMAMLSLFSGISIGMAIGLMRRILWKEHHPRKPGKRHILYVWLWIILFHAVAIIFVVRPYADLQLNTSFQQRLKVLAPILEDLELKELEAAWASMQTREDYEAIKMRLEKTAEAHSITLPKALWK